MDLKQDAIFQDYMQLLLRQHGGSVWRNFYESGGYGMYPTTIFGFCLVLAACMYCFRLERKYLPFVLTTGALTLASGVLGTFTGLMFVFHYAQYVEPSDVARIAVVGAKEAFANIVFALVLVILSGLAMLGGIVRRAWREPV